MPPLKSLNGRATHLHDTDTMANTATDRCPWCKQPISRQEYNSIRERIANEERARVAKVEKGLQEKYAREKAQAETQAKAAIEKATKAATVAADKKLKLLRANQEATIAARLDAERERAAKKQAEAVNAEKLQHAAEKLKLEEQLADMQRRLQAKTAHQLGDPAEVDLFMALETAFPDDGVRRIAKGRKGPDVVMEVMHRSEPVGKIVFDSKNYSPRRWSNAMTKKLRADQLAEGADFAILCSSVFPAGAQELYLQDNVIVASPQRIVVLTHLLRRQVVENHRLRLTAAARDEKAEKLLAYVISPTCTDLLDRIVGLTRDLTDLDRVETAAHQKTWTKRADLIRALHAIHEEFSSTVSGIIAGEQGVAA